MKAYKQQDIRSHNLQLLKNILRRHVQAMTKKQLADASALSVVTINKLMPALVEAQDVLALEIPQKTGGRFAQMYQFNAEKALLLVLQFIEQDSAMIVRSVVVDLLGKPIFKQEQPVSSVPQFLTEAAKLVKQFPQIAQTIVGIPGAEVDGRLKIMDVDAFRDVALSDLLASELGHPVSIENDINAATLGYARASQQIVAGVYFPEAFPPGSALVVNQQIFKGRNQLSGEIKHLAQFSLEVMAFQEVVQMASQAIVAMYDPEEVVCYLNPQLQTRVDKAALQANLANVFPYGVLPEIIFSAHFETDYLAGLIKLGLNQIEQWAGEDE